MDVWSFFWDDENDPNGNIEHIGEHDLTVPDVEHVLKNPTDERDQQIQRVPRSLGIYPRWPFYHRRL